MFNEFRRIFSRALLKKGKVVEQASSYEELNELFIKLWPQRTKFDLIRVGGANDGGYLVPNCLEEISQCFSPGVGDSSSFEDDLYERFNISSVMLDHTIEKKILKDSKSIFLQKKLSYEKQHGSLDLEELVEKYSSDNNDKILQMDIEGSEYEILINTKNETLKKFRIIIIEFHHLHGLRNMLFLRMFNSLISKLMRSFTITHLHANNFAERFNLYGNEYSSCLEITFLRKDEGAALGDSSLPHRLDQPCCPKLPEVFLKKPKK